MEALDLEEPRGSTRSEAYQGYLQLSSAPLTGFIFALPLFIVYHVGLWWLRTFAEMGWANAMDIAIANLLGYLGMAGPFLSFVLVVVVFLSMHAVSGRAWRWPSLSYWLLMVVESLALAVPVFFLSRIVVHILAFLPLSAAAEGSAAGAISPMSWQASAVLSCGAGVYEEFFFRVLIMGGLCLFFDRVLGVRGVWMYLFAAVLQALLFSASHHLPGGMGEILSAEQAREAIPAFTFRSVAGIYFAFVYIERGFGIAAGAHAGYDLMVVLLEEFAPQGLFG